MITLKQDAMIRYLEGRRNGVINDNIESILNNIELTGFAAYACFKTGVSYVFRWNDFCDRY